MMRDLFAIVLLLFLIQSCSEDGITYCVDDKCATIKIKEFTV